jgi:hypothetical protein
MKLRSRTLIALGVALLLLLGGATSALGARNSPKATWGPTTWNGQSTFPIYRNLGVSIYETDLKWDAVAPTRPQNPRDPNDPAYRWPPDVTSAMQQASSYHMRTLLLVIGAPAWANGGHPSNYPPTNPQDLADFMTAAARHYSTVHLWMVWGEPDRQVNFAIDKKVAYYQRKLTAAQAQAPHLYAQMLDASYGALKAVSKSNMVIGGNTTTTGDIQTKHWVDYLRLPNGKPPRMDMYGHNPFSSRVPKLSNRQLPYGYYDFSDLGRLSQLVNRELARRGHNIRLFLSEFAIPTAPDNEFPFYVSRATQARWTAAAWRIVRSSPFIYSLGWVEPFDDTPSGNRKGLLTAQGTPKPAYYAFKRG